MKTRADDVTINYPSPGATGSRAGTLDLKIVSVLGRDGIPAILNPQFLTAPVAFAQMQPAERILGLYINGDHRAYSLNMLSRHEIVNDVVGGTPVAVTWRPLCFTGVVYARGIAGTVHTFGVSGKLIMNTLVMYDHQSDTLWSQFLSRGVKGPWVNTQLETVPVLQTSWQQWLRLHPNTLVLNKKARYQTDGYDGYYRGGSAGIIGESNKDDRLSREELVLRVELSGVAKAYPVQAMAGQGAINDIFSGNHLLVTFDPLSETGSAFDRTVDGNPLTFEGLPGKSVNSSVTNGGPGRVTGDEDSAEILLLRDKETRSTWQAVTGRAIDGPLAGTALKPLPSIYAFWFAWSDFHPGTELYEPIAKSGWTGPPVPYSCSFVPRPSASRVGMSARSVNCVT